MTSTSGALPAGVRRGLDALDRQLHPAALGVLLRDGHLGGRHVAVLVLLDHGLGARGSLAGDRLRAVGPGHSRGGGAVVVVLDLGLVGRGRHGRDVGVEVGRIHGGSLVPYVGTRHAGLHSLRHLSCAGSTTAPVVFRNIDGTGQLFVLNKIRLLKDAVLLEFLGAA